MFKIITAQRCGKFNFMTFSYRLDFQLVPCLNPRDGVTLRRYQSSSKWRYRALAIFGNSHFNHLLVVGPKAIELVSTKTDTLITCKRNSKRCMQLTFRHKWVDLWIRSLWNTPECVYISAQLCSRTTSYSFSGEIKPPVYAIGVYSSLRWQLICNIGGLSRCQGQLKTEHNKPVP